MQLEPGIPVLQPGILGTETAQISRLRPISGNEPGIGESSTTARASLPWAIKARSERGGSGCGHLSHSVRVHPRRSYLSREAGFTKLAFPSFGPKSYAGHGCRTADWKSSLRVSMRQDSAPNLFASAGLHRRPKRRRCVLIPIDHMPLRRDTKINIRLPPSTGSALQRDDLTIGKGEAFGLQSDDVDEQR